MTEPSRIAYHFFVCTNERPDGHPLPSCAPRGGQEVLEAFGRELAKRGFPQGVKVTAAGCLTPCNHGPNVVVYPEGIWYANLTPADAATILAVHLDGVGTADHLRLAETVRLT
ncbi:MAG: (2Fe-2S) ferredoxin domain-containing protein [Janthinobacterium lividum]